MRAAAGRGEERRTLGSEDNFFYGFEDTMLWRVWTDFQRLRERESIPVNTELRVCGKEDVRRKKIVKLIKKETCLFICLYINSSETKNGDNKKGK